jgi:hypothetical protein
MLQMATTSTNALLAEALNRAATSYTVAVISLLQLLWCSWFCGTQNIF